MGELEDAKFATTGLSILSFFLDTIPHARMAEETKDSTEIPVLGGDRPVSPLPRAPRHPGAPPPVQHHRPNSPRMEAYRPEISDEGHLRQQMKTTGDTPMSRGQFELWADEFEIAKVTAQRWSTHLTPARVQRDLFFSE